MLRSPLIKRHPQVKILDCASTMTQEEVYSHVEPYFTWRLLELDGMYNILICTSCEEGAQMLILQGQAAQEWLRYHLSRLPEH
jgi:hypothetical protein